jgi:hypothetical protein
MYAACVAGGLQTKLVCRIAAPSYSAALFAKVALYPVLHALAQQARSPIFAEFESCLLGDMAGREIPHANIIWSVDQIMFGVGVSKT